MTASHLLRRLQKKRLLVKSRKRGMHKGQRQANSYGSSLEFSDFRLYQPGDDVRQIDWNIFGRTQKHYIKRFLDEQEVSIAIYLDATSSMRAITGKWELAKQLAASLCFVVLNSEDRLSFCPVSTTAMLPVTRKGSVYGKMVFHDIMKMAEQDKTGNFSERAQQALVKRQQLAILISDGLEPAAQIEGLFKKLRSLRQEVWFIQVLGTEELRPGHNGDIRLIDSETDTVVNVSMNEAIAREYRARIAEHNKQLEALCRRFGGHYLLLTEDKDLQTFLFHDLPGKGLMN
ncbi:DUF58 domain-containing protein [Bacillus sp. T33-2]|uniref:DUF58 domain-containing protein n=1 Tax=Bacillus sp. T33-2 TaxID=2054168 RepID=UPI000C7708F2|nr:DUF58 domain-containing protein [Bacillus sp. T33-2]PLR97306.1 DUF58 domain-containing protein [Bacillus sp. T33-2]